MLHAKILIRIDTIVLIHHVIHIHASVEAIIDLALILIVLIELVHVAAHDGGIIVIVDVFLIRSRRATLNFSSLDLLSIICAVAAVICTTSHVLFY